MYLQVTKDFRRREELFPVDQDNNRKRKRRGDEEKVIQHLDEELQGQHGGELLVHFPLSENNGLLGIIVQKTHVSIVIVKLFIKYTEADLEGFLRGLGPPFVGKIG